MENNNNEQKKSTRQFGFTQFKPLEEKTEELKAPEVKEFIEGKKELKPRPFAVSVRDQVAKEHNLRKPTVGIRFDLDEDLNMDLDIICIKTGKNKKDFLLECVQDAIIKAKNKIEKII